MRTLALAALVLAALAVPAHAGAATPHASVGSTELAQERRAGSAGASREKVLAVHFDLEVNPATQSYLNHEIDRAAADGYDAVVILLDTPGGLSDSMRKIVQKELSSKVPVIAYVSPAGARAASAGVWIGEAADILAMAPQTNIGSSTPINQGGQNLGSDLRRKVVNDAAASLRALMKAHGRNAAWGDKAVKVASNLTAGEALKLNVIDLIAPTLPALLRTIDGQKTVPRGFVLHTAGAEVVEAKPGFLTRLLSTLIDPNIVSLLFLAGIAGIGFEIFHPGVVLPGALGAVCLFTALFGFSVLPIAWSGMALVLLGIALLIVDLHVVSHGALTLSGLVSLAIGLVMLFHNSPSPYTISVPLVVALTACIGGFWAFAIGKALAIRRKPALMGPDDVVGERGEVRQDGLVFVRGELWHAHSDDGAPLHPGDEVEIERVEENGLVLGVRRV